MFNLRINHLENCIQSLGILLPMEMQEKLQPFLEINCADLQEGKLKKTKGGVTVELAGTPSEPEKDWVVLLQKM